LKNQSIFCFSITDYGNDITVGKDHLMVQFAKHNNVVMFNLSGSRTPSITRRYDLNRLFRKVLKWFLLPKKLNNIIIVYPIRFPFIGNRIIDIINNKILYFYLAFYKMKFFSKSPIIITLSPFYNNAIKRVKPKKIIYYVSDDYGLFTGNNKTAFDVYEKEFIPQCNGVITVSEPLYNKKRKYNNNTIRIFNATNPNLFAGDNLYKPDDMKKFSGKIVGCVGKIDDWYDLEFVDELASLNKNVNFVFVGPLVRSIDNIGSKNIYFLGQKEYNEMPNYIHAFDICIIPYKDIDRIRTVDLPLKLLDYMAAGKPVIAKNINLIEELSNLYSICNNLTEFAKVLSHKLKYGDNLKKERLDFAYKNSWEIRAREISNWIIN